MDERQRSMDIYGYSLSVHSVFDSSKYRMMQNKWFSNSSRHKDLETLRSSSVSMNLHGAIGLQNLKPTDSYCSNGKKKNRNQAH